MGWLAYVAAWLAAALFWSLAAASSTASSPLETLPYGLLAMGSAALMGVAVWRLTNRVMWNWRAPSFYAVHGLALVAYSTIYATSWIWPEAVSGRLGEAVGAWGRSPVLVWNLLMGSWLYLLVTGLSAVTPVRSDLIRIVPRIRRAAYEGDRVALQRQHAELAPLRRRKDARMASRVRYWQAYAMWQRSINGFNDGHDPKELERDLRLALRHFEDALRKQPVQVRIMALKRTASAEPDDRPVRAISRHATDR